MPSSARQPAFRGPRHAALPILAILAIQALGCGACSQAASTHLGTIGKDGGKLHSDDCGFTLEIPAGALPQDVPFVLQTASDPHEPAITGRVRVSKVCTVQPVIPFAKPAQVTLTFDPAQVPAQVSAKDVDLRLAPSEQKEVRLQDQSVDVDAKTVKATTTATGDFFATSPQGPQVAEIDLTPADAVALNPGQSQQYAATVKDDTGQPDPTPVAWSTATPRVASIDANGLLTANAPGRTQVTATAGGQSASVDVYVLSQQPSPASFTWENPRPQGNDIHGLSFADGQLLVAANNGTVLLGKPDGSFQRLTSVRGLALAGAAAGGGRAGAAGNLDLVQQSVEVVSGVLVPLEPGASAQTVAATDLSPSAVYADDAGVIAVGAGNAAYLLRQGDPTDAGWVALETPVSEALLAVDADPTAGRRVVGARGQVYRQENQDWFPIWDQPLDTLLTGATVMGHEAYAVDAASGLRHFVEGQGWVGDSAPAGTALDHVSLLGHLDDALVLAAQDTQLQPHLWSRSAGSWTELTGLDVRDELFAAAGQSADGGLVGGSNGALYRVEGAALTPLRQGSIEDIAAISVAPDGSAFAVTENGCGDARCQSTAGHLLVRQADGTWIPLAGFEAPVSLHAVAARSSGDVFLGGEGGAAWHFDGQTATPLATPNTSTIRAMKVCGSDVWLAGDSGLLAKFDGAQVFNARGSFSSSLRALACTDANDLWAAGNYTIAHFDGTSWSPVDTGINDQAWRAISVSSDEVWVTGETPYLVHGDRVAGTWDAVSEPAGLRLHGGYGLWQSGPGDLYLVGSQQRPREAVLLRYDGAQWYALDAATDHELFAIDGAGPGAFFIAGRGGAILSASSKP